jgi:hypothetical protein
MKAMTWSQLGGNGSQKLSAYTWDGMLKAMTKYGMERHPQGLARDMQRLNHEDPERWARAMKPNWDATPEQGCLGWGPVAMAFTTSTRSGSLATVAV